MLLILLSAITSARGSSLMACMWVYAPSLLLPLPLPLKNMKSSRNVVVRLISAEAISELCL